LVILEILKARLNKGLIPNLYFWRDIAGHEIDLIAEWGGSTKTIDIKASATLQPNFVKNLNYFHSLDDTIKQYVIYTGQEGFYSNAILLPIESITRLLDE
jgi:uncharacterized protein